MQGWVWLHIWVVRIHHPFFCWGKSFCGMMANTLSSFIKLSQREYVCLIKTLLVLHLGCSQGVYRYQDWMPSSEFHTDCFCVSVTHKSQRIPPSTLTLCTCMFFIQEVGIFPGYVLIQVYLINCWKVVTLSALKCSIWTSLLVMFQINSCSPVATIVTRFSLRLRKSISVQIAQQINPN